MSVKVGQIYQEPIEHGFKFVITKVKPYNDKVIRKFYCTICDDGDVIDRFFEIDIKQHKLIAEYPTWQEAVNSKEFEGE